MQKSAVGGAKNGGRGLEKNPTHFKSSISIFVLIGGVGKKINLNLILIGGVGEKINLNLGTDPTKLFNILFKAFNRGSMLASSIGPNPNCHEQKTMSKYFKFEKKTLLKVFIVC